MSGVWGGMLVAVQCLGTVDIAEKMSSARLLNEQGIK